MFEVPIAVWDEVTSTILISDGFGNNILANISSQLGDTGTLVVVGIAAGVPLAFYVIRRLIALIPKGR